MALPKLTRKYSLWALNESVYGTDPIPDSSNAVLVDSLDIKFDVSIIERDDITLPDLSKCSHLIGKYAVELTFNVDLRGSGTPGTAPDYGPLLRACSMSETENTGVDVVYEPLSSNQESCTIYCNKDGLMHKIVGCVGTFSLAASVGQPGKLSFTMRGKLKENPTDVVLSTGSACTLAPPLLLGATFTYGGWSPTIANFSMDIANVLTERQDITEASGIQGFFVSNRKPVIGFDPEMVSVATRNVWNYFRTLNEAALALSFGTYSGNIISIAAPKCVKRGIPYGDRDGISTFQIEASLVRTSGDDEMSFTLT